MKRKNVIRAKEKNERKKTYNEKEKKNEKNCLFC